MALLSEDGVASAPPGRPRTGIQNRRDVFHRVLGDRRDALLSETSETAFGSII
jgi:hypothetical protein